MCRVEAASAADDSRVWRTEHTAQLSTRRIWQMMMMMMINLWQIILFYNTYYFSVLF